MTVLGRRTQPVTTLRRGLYRHEVSGRLIVHTYDVLEGPRGGRHDGWEHATWDSTGGDLTIDGSQVFTTLRAAAAALDRGLPR